MGNDSVIMATADNFDQEVIKSTTPVLVDFWAQWCGPCRTVAPVIEELAITYQGKAKVAKINVDEQSDLAAKFKIMSIPTVMIFKDGEIVEKIIGARSKQEFSNLLDKYI